MPVFRLTNDLIFPPVYLADPDGLLAVGGDLSVERLLLAYRSGIFPWYSEGEPVLWWSPNPRLVLYPDEFHVSKSLRRALRSGAFSVTFDHAFDAVIQNCAGARGPGRTGTWITRAMIKGYSRLHRAGYAHSVETWQDGRLVGGLYGVALGTCFFGESMFSDVSNASKVALATLVARLKDYGYTLIDCQVRTDHLVSLGAREITRKAFLEHLDKAVGPATGPAPGPWDERAEA